MSDDGLEYCPHCGKSFIDDTEKSTEDAEEKSGRASEDNSQPHEKKEPIDLRFANYSPFADTYSGYTPPQKEQSPLGKLFSAMLHAVCYFILFLGLQSLVAAGVQTAVMFAASTEYITDYFNENGIDISSLPTEEYTAIIEQLAPQVESLMLEAAYDVDYNLISVISSCLTVLALFIIAKCKKRRFADHTSTYFDSLKNPRVYAVIPAALGLQSVIIFIINIIPFPQSVIDSYNELYSFIGESPLWLEILSVVVLAPIVEELIFRGCIHSRLRRAMKPLTAALISAFIFGAAHGHIISVTYAFLLGLVLTYLYEKYDTVTVPILFHMAFNGSNYLPIMTSESTLPEILITVGVSAAIFAICAYIVISGPPKKSKEQKETEESDKGI